MLKVTLSLLFLLAVSTAMADVNPDGSFTSRSFPVVVNNTDEGSKTLVYEELIFSGPSITKRLWSQQSSDNGATWSPRQPVSLGPARAPQIVTSLQGGASLLWRAGAGYLLFHHYGGASPSDIWRTPSVDGASFVESTQVDLGWPASGGVQPGSGLPSVVIDGPASISMLYQRFIGDATSPAGLYLARSLDQGVTWSPVRTLVTTDAHLGARAMLVHRSSAPRYVATYEVQWADDDNRVMVKTTDNVGDWSAPAVLEIAGNNADPSLVVMPDGAFVLLYARKSAGQSDLFARRSTDGITWADEIQLTDTPDQIDSAPFAVSGSSPGVVDLYWAQTPDLTPSGSNIVHDASVVVLDPVYAGGFDD